MIARLSVEICSPPLIWREVQCGVALGKDVLSYEEKAREVGLGDGTARGKQDINFRRYSSILSNRPHRRIVDRREISNYGFDFSIFRLRKLTHDFTVGSVFRIPDAGQVHSN